ncbi:hypothetical protein GCM10009619_41980 [Williamsia maris]
MGSEPKLYAVQIRPTAEIIELSPDGSTIRTAATVTGHCRDGIAVDVETSAVLWTHMGTPTNMSKAEFFDPEGQIFRTTADGASVPLLSHSQSVTPKQLTLDSCRRLL